MRNYIILNGKNSNEINGLLIQELPPISKPLIRTEVEEIDGRDGDIVTPLGYSAYDKEFTIGLYKDFDVNEVAAYFNSEGTVIFSNEPDKYYYYQITAQIDFERLVRYRTATVTMHCQPFKYSATEQPITEDVSGTVSDEGTNLALENTAEAPFNTLDLKGNTSQQTYVGKNLLKLEGNTTEKGLTISRDATTGALTFGGTTTGTWPWLNNSDISLPAGTYTFSIDRALPYDLYLRLYETSSSYPKSCIIQAGQTSGTATTTYSIVYLAMLYGVASSGTQVPTTTIHPMLESGSTATTPFEPYTNGPAPNPDYPQAVQTVTGENVVKITGKNLVNINNFQNGSYTSTTGEWISYGSRACTIDKIPVKPSSTYVVDNHSTNGYTIKNLVDAYKADGTFISRLLNNGSNGATFTTTADTAFINLTLSETSDTMRWNDYQTDFANGTIQPQIELGSTATAYEPYQGQSYEVNLGKNLFDKDGANSVINAYFDSSKIYTGNSFRTAYIECEPNTTYTVSKIQSARFAVGTTTAQPANDVAISGFTQDNTATKITITTGAGAKYLCVFCYHVTYAAYFEPIELCGLGDDGAGGYLYQDYIYKNLTDNKWYVRKEVGKHLFDGSETFTSDSSYSGIYQYRWTDSSVINTSSQDAICALSDKFYGRSYRNSWEYDFSVVPRINANALRFMTSLSSTIGAFQTWLSSNPTTVYYALATPTDTEITNEALIAQLDDIYYHAHAYKGRTHITSSAATGNMPHIIAAEVGEDNESTITNAGNYLSKPKITVYGSGDISLYINDMHVLQITLGDEGYITIDTAQMEAYKDTLDNLKNRLVIGDYSNARLKPGANKIHFTGTVTKYIVENYSRWL